MCSGNVWRISEAIQYFCVYNKCHSRSCTSTYVFMCILKVYAYAGISSTFTDTIEKMSGEVLVFSATD